MIIIERPPPTAQGVELTGRSAMIEREASGRLGIWKWLSLDIWNI
jgi:hypothetical protein